MTPRTFAPCAAFAREAFAVPKVPWSCDVYPPTKRAIKTAEHHWANRYWRSAHVSADVGGVRVHANMKRTMTSLFSGLGTGVSIWVSLSKPSAGTLLPEVQVEATPIDTLPARIHAAACALLATYAARLEAQAAALTEEAAAVRALIPTPEPAPKARPTCPLCNTNADAPTVERLLLVPHTVHLPCSAVCHHTPEPGDAADRLPEFIEAHLPDAPAGSLRHAEALAALARDYPGILTIAAALKAAQPVK